MAHERWSYPVIHMNSTLNVVLGSQRSIREEYFNVGRVAKVDNGLKLWGHIFQGTSAVYRKRWENTVERKNISNLICDDRWKQCCMV